MTRILVQRSSGTTSSTASSSTSEAEHQPQIECQDAVRIEERSGEDSGKSDRTSLVDTADDSTTVAEELDVVESMPGLSQLRLVENSRTDSGTLNSSANSRTNASMLEQPDADTGEIRGVRNSQVLERSSVGIERCEKPRANFETGGVKFDERSSGTMASVSPLRPGLIPKKASWRSPAWPVISMRTSPAHSRPSSPRSHSETEGYNSADEQNSCYLCSFDDMERESQFEIDIKRSKGLEVKRMLEDGNCLFRAVADQVYGDSELHDLTRQLCIDYMEREKDHFSQFITEGFSSYCKRKRRDKVYGNNVEIQALSEMYNRPIHIYSYSTEPINIFHGSYITDMQPIRLSYHHGNHYNSLVDPRSLAIGSGLGFSSLHGRNVDKDQVKAAIKAQQDQQIDKVLLAEGQFYSDVELTEKEIERMVMEASRAEYLAASKKDSTHGAEPSSSSGASQDTQANTDPVLRDPASCRSIQTVLSMGFSHTQAIEAYSIFGDDLDSMVCYLLETVSGHKGKSMD